LAAAVGAPDRARTENQDVPEDMRNDIEQARVMPAADTVFLRHPGIMPSLDAANVQRFQASALVQEFAATQEILAPLQDHPDPVVRYRAFLELARAAFQANRGRPSPVSDRALSRALEQPVPPAVPTVDAVFLRGYSALHRHQLRAARTDLTDALAGDPAFLDAARWLVAAEAAEIDRASGRAFGPDACEAVLLEIFGHVRHLGVLVTNINQFRDIGRDISGMAALNGPFGRFVAGYIALLSRDRPSARTAFSAVPQRRGALSVSCHRVLVGHVTTVLNDLDTALRSVADDNKRGAQ